MNEEYLWQKTGEDPEITALENALSRFRYEETLPPALPAPSVKPARSRWTFAVGFAVPAFATLAISISLLLPTANHQSGPEITFVYHPSADAVEPPRVEPEPPATQPITPPKPVRHGRVHVQSVRASKSRPQSPQARFQKAVLTKEEQHAYDQVVLALSISSSSLNVVRDTINGVDSGRGFSKQNNR